METTVATFDVFLSHNSRDKPQVERIAERLRGAGLEPWLDKWALVPGGEWQEELGAGIEASSSCAVFIGPDDLGDWEEQEVSLAVDRAAKDRGFRVFPVLLPGVREPFDPNRLPHFLRARTWVDFRRGYEDKRALQDLVHAIKGIPFGPETLTLRTDDVCPYRGLEVFDAEHAEFYFGRDGEIQRLLEKLKTDRFLAVLGPSGSGKSSLVRAGLLPALLRGALGGGSWRSCVVRPGAAPLTALAAALAPDGGLADTLDGLRGDMRTLHLELVQMVGGDAPEDRVVVVVDQLEEVFTLCRDDDERKALFANLIYAAAAPGGPGVVVVTMRADFYQRCAPYPELSQLVSGQQLLVGPMSRDAERQAIEEPARRVGLEFEEGLIDTILDDAGSSAGSLPLLEYALLELWERRRGTMLTLEGYRDAGGVEGALAKRAENVIAELSPAEQELARRTLLRLTMPGEGTEDTRRRAPLSELAGMEPVVDRLVAARLLTTSTGAGEEVVDVSHEALIRAWPRLRAWIDADRAGLLLQRRLTEAVDEWEELDRDDSALYRGARLAEAREWAGTEEDELNPLEREFLDASAALAEREQRERDEQARRELEVARRGRRRLLIAAGALLIGLVVAGVAAVVAVEQRNAADRERDIALSRQLAALSEQQMPVDPELAVLLAREAAHTARTAQAEDALRAALQSPIRGTLRGPSADSNEVLAVAGDRVATGGLAGKVRVWDAATEQLIGELDGPGIVSGLEFSPDGTRLAMVGEKGVRIVAAPGPAQPPATPPQLFSASGNRVIAPNRSGGPCRFVVALVDGWSGRTVARLGRREPTSSAEVMCSEAVGVLDTVFVSGGRRIVTVGTEGTQLWSARDGRLVRTWDTRGAGSASADVAGDRVAISDAYGPPVGGQGVAVHVRDVRTGREIARRLAGYSTVQLSPDGRRVLLDSDGLLWNVETGRTVKVGAVGTMAAFSPGGDWLATSTDDGAVVRDVLTGRRVTEMTVGRTEPAAIAFGGENRLFTVHADGMTREWSVAALRLEGDRGMADVAAASGDGKLVAGLSGSADPVVWDAASGRLRVGRPQRGALEGQFGYAIGFAPSGQLVHETVDQFNIETGFRVVDPQTGLAVRSFGRAVQATDAEGVQTLGAVVDRLRFTDARGRETLADTVGTDVALSPDGRLAAVADGENAEVLETPRLERRTRLDADDAGPENLRFSPDGTRVLADDLDGRVYVWNLATGRRVVLTAHTGFIESLAFSDDGRYVVSAGDDGAARVWSADSGRLLAELPSSGAAALLPGNRSLVTLGSGPPLIRECDGCGTWDQLVERIDARARRELTPDERAAYLR